MPIFIDILENKVLGPPYKRGLEEGKREGELADREALRADSGLGRGTSGRPIRARPRRTQPPCAGRPEY